MRSLESIAPGRTLAKERRPALIVYPRSMNLAAILRELDAEIEKLERARKIIQGVADSPRNRRRQPRQTSLPLAAAVIPEPQIVVLPPKMKREYRPRVKPKERTAVALAPALFDKPVFVPRVVVSPPIATTPKTVEFNVDVFEAAVRQNLLRGGA
jgi:hypothetical protein